MMICSIIIKKKLGVKFKCDTYLENEFDKTILYSHSELNSMRHMKKYDLHIKLNKLFVTKTI